MRQPQPLARCLHVTCAFAVVLASGFACEVVTDPVDSDSVWRSRDNCESLWSERASRPTALRIGTWNIRYFPDSQEGNEEDAEDATDVRWLACAVASLETPLIMVQEFKTTARAVEKARALIDRLNELTGGAWQLSLAPCEPKEVQHPGFLFDATRVSASHLREVPVISPDPNCNNSVSPGYAGYFSVVGGPDFHAISVHLQTERTAWSVQRREYSVMAMAAAADEAYALVPDRDIVFGGDFNSHGCDECEPPISSAQEVEGMMSIMAAFETPLRLVPASESCTSDDGDAHLIDHFAVAESMAEVPAGAVAHVSGYCEDTGCEGDIHLNVEARERLSDHCPLTLELAASDDD